MPRTVSGAISALIGQKSLSAAIYLVKWELGSGTRYYSSGAQVVYGGNTYLANRVKSVSGLTSQFIDRKTQEFGKASFSFDNLSDTGSSVFPFVAIEAAEPLEQTKISVFIFFPDATDAVLFWWGYTDSSHFNDEEKLVDVSATFLWDSPSVVIPSKTLQEAGFATLETNRNSENAADETVVPLVYGVSSFRFRPTIYAIRSDQGYLHINFVVSGCPNGFPFSGTDLLATDIKFRGVTQAAEVEFITGSFAQTAPANLTRFPDGGAHAGVAYGYCAIPITDDIKDSLDNLEPDEIKMTLVSGRRLAATGLPSENPVLILKDIITDPVFGLGVAAADFDATSITNSSAYVASKFQSRLEIHEHISVKDLCQRMLLEIGGYLTFNSGKIQIGVKNNAETSIATFATSDSGTGGRLIHNDVVPVDVKGVDELKNALLITYRKKTRHQRKFNIYDPTAQTRPGGTIKRPVKEDIELLSLYTETQAIIAGAITLREEQNGNLFIEFTTPLLESIDVAPGDVVTVKSPGIFSNASNYLFRVIAQTPDAGDEPVMRNVCQIYKPAIYDYSSSGIGVDILRGAEDTSSQGRPPDVVPSLLQIVDIIPNDTDGKLATVRAFFGYPSVNLASEIANDNVAREYPIAAVQIWWKYTDEFYHEAKFGKEVKYPTSQADFQVDYQKNRAIEVFFIALGHNRSRAPLGYIPDLTKETTLTANLSSTAVTASVAATANFAVNDLVFIENEIDKVQSKTSNTLTFVSSGAVRTPQVNTSNIAHPSGTEVSVAKPSYPSLVISLTPPRFTVAIVTGLIVRQRGDGVRIVYDALNSTNKDEYYIYWSTDSDAGSNVNKLSAAFPTWYSVDPNTPPSGVNLIKTDASSHKLTQEIIGASGTTVFVRIAARNGKHNFSSNLSALGSNNSTGATMPATAAPNNGVTLNTPEAKLKKKGLVINFDVNYPQVTQLSHQYNVIIIHDNNATGTGRKYFDPQTATWVAVYTDAVNNGTTEIKVGKTGHVVLPVNASDLFVGGRTSVYIRVGIRNDFAGGSTTYSGDLSRQLLQSGSDGDPAPSDTAIPGPLNTPKLVWKRGKLLAKLALDGTNNIGQLKTCELTITDGTNSLNIDDLTSNSPVSGVVYYQLGLVPPITIPVSLQQLKIIFGQTAQLKCAFRLTNGIGPATSAFSTLLPALNTLSDYSHRSGSDNELWNGDFVFNDTSGDPTVLGNWEQYNPATGVKNNITTTASRFRWDQANHRGFFRQNDTTANRRYLAQNLFRTMIRGDYHSQSFFLSSNSSLTADLQVFLATLFTGGITGTVSINGTTTITGINGVSQFLSELKPGSEVGINNEIRTVLNVSSNYFATVTVAFTTTVSGVPCFAATPQSQIIQVPSTLFGTTDKLIELTFQCASDMPTDKDIYVCYRTNTTITTAGPFLNITRINMEPGQVPGQFKRRVLYERNINTSGMANVGGFFVPVAAENFSVVPSGGVGGNFQELSGDVPGSGGIAIY